MKNVLMVSGYARSGKDTTCDVIVNALSDNLSCEVMSFADDMKGIICKTFDIDKTELDSFKNNIDKYSLCTMFNYSIKMDETDFREILQRFGTEAMKSVFGNDVWINLVKKKIKESDADVIVIPDWRFKQEYWKIMNDIGIQGDNVITVRVHRDGLVNKSTHQSEIDLDTDIDFDYNIMNDGVSLSCLEEQVRYMLQQEGL